MKHHLVLATACYLAIGWSWVSSLRVTGLEGETVHIRCPHTAETADKDKYFCRGESRYRCRDILLTERGTVTTLDERFSLTFDPTVGEHQQSAAAAVQIRDLRANDSGTYWCGSDRRSRYRDYVQVHLSVGRRREKEHGTTQNPSTPLVAKLHPRPPTPPGMSLTIIISISVLAAFVFTVTGLTIIRLRGKHTEGTYISNVPGTKFAIDDYENNGQDKSITELTSVYQSQHLNFTQPDAVYQHLNPNTTQPDAVYQRLNPNTTQPDGVYQSLNPITTQPNAVYHSLNPNTTQPESLYQTLVHNPDQGDSTYQSLHPNSTQHNPIYLNQ
ncbi:uncharacterized protein LOC121719549 [Alosa sapidissima]|uniref:uncharacterized protein LOC121719549 n=1 Tax=Alosa sapidissima TaxID=34773 RepID=UPI001C088374|nr:uncharacterized protein LOC121719549 [Alosa sapidissima]